MRKRKMGAQFVLKNHFCKKRLFKNQFSALCQVRGFDRLTRSAIGKIEVGQRRIQLEELKLFRELLKTTYDELLNE